MKRHPPLELDEAVELWARQRGTHARLYWSELLRCFVIDIELTSEDPRLGKWQRGELRNKPVESVPLHVWNKEKRCYVALPIEEWGVSTLIDELDEADLLSGRGRYNTLYHALVARQAENEARREELAAQVSEVGREAAWLHRRSIKDLPFVSVAADIHEEGEANHGDQARNPEDQSTGEAHDPGAQGRAGDG